MPRRIGVGHALLLAKLQPAQQEQALANCFREEWNGAGAKAKRILLPVRHLQQWIEQNILLLLKQAPFNKRDPQLVPAAGSCVDCPKRTGHNKLLFADVSGNTDACTDPNCYAAKLDAHVKAKVAAKPEACPDQHGIQAAAGRREDHPAQQVRRNPGGEARHAGEGEVAGVQDVQVHHRGHRRRTASTRANCGRFAPSRPARFTIPKKQTPKADASFKAEQEKRRREEALANATGIRVLQSIVAAVPVRLMKRDLLFVAEQLLPLLDEKRLEMVARNRSIKAKEGESVAKLLAAFVRKADEGTIGKLIVEAVILLSARTQADGGKMLRAAAQVYGVDTDAVALKVKQEFAAKEKARKAAKPEPKSPAKAEAKTVKKTAA